MVKKIKFYNGVYKKNKRYPTSFQAYIWGQLFYFGVTYFFFFFGGYIWKSNHCIYYFTSNLLTSFWNKMEL